MKGLSIEVTEQSLSEAENTYQKGILSDIDKKKNPKQMEEWSYALTDEESASGSEDLDDSIWQMLSQDGASALHDSHIGDLNM